MKTKAFKRCFLGFGTAFAVLLPGLSVARTYGTMINNALNIKTYEIVANENSDPEASIYFKSDYNSVDEVKAAGEQLVTKVEESGLVLLKNDNNALPLSMATPKVSLFGDGASSFNYTPSLSGGSVDVGKYKTFKKALEDEGFQVNENLWNYYKNYSGSGRSNSVSGLVRTYKINEVPWNDIKTNNEASFSNYGNAAIVVFTRDSGEGYDTSTKGSDGRNGVYLGLSTAELDLLKGLTTYKKSGIFERIVVILNSSNAIELNFLKDNDIDVDSIIWSGNVGGFGLEAISRVLKGTVNPSGKLSDTYVKEALSSPAAASWVLNADGIFAQEYKNAKDYNDLTKTGVAKYYGVYVEGIYVGYRYYETRYEDVKLNKANVGEFNYDEEVAYPFGHGLSYSSFTYNNFKVRESGDKKSYTVTVDVKNVGSVAGREVVEVYGQKPYTANGLEKASIELLGYKKTANLEAGATETVSVTVKKEQFKSYDNITNKTYILDEGDYYLAVGKNAHDALNNVLAKKGVSGGNAGFAAVAFHQNELDNKTYAKSSQTGAQITNQLDAYDINTYANRGENSVTYVSRNNWKDTFPKEAVSLSINANMANDLASHKPIEQIEDVHEYLYAEENGGSLINLRGLPYDHELWDSLLDQMTFQEQSLLLSNGAFGTSSIESISLPGTKAKDGPNFVTDTATNVAMPSEGIWASSFDEELLYEIGDYLAEDARINGVDTLYAPGINIHRAPFIGRSHEYFSEDPYLSANSVMNEIKGMQAKGVVSVVKHYAFNDEDAARNGISVWLNEQAAREIYLLPFEYAIGINYANGHACMSGFNRAGCEWVGASNALQNIIAREEWGFDGYFITDMASSNGALYMTFDDGIVGGTDIWLGSGSKTTFKDFKNDLTFKHLVRQAVHRLLYVQVNFNCTMNGIAADTTIITLTPWWDTLLSSLMIGTGVLASISFVLSVALIFVKGKKE